DLLGCPRRRGPEPFVHLGGDGQATRDERPARQGALSHAPTIGFFCGRRKPLGRRGLSERRHLLAIRAMHVDAAAQDPAADQLDLPSAPSSANTFSVRSSSRVPVPEIAIPSASRVRQPTERRPPRRARPRTSSRKRITSPTFGGGFRAIHSVI